MLVYMLAIAGYQLDHWMYIYVYVYIYVHKYIYLYTCIYVSYKLANGQTAGLDQIE